MESTKELNITRTFIAPLELIWDVWTKPEHIIQWWGPDGFTNTIHQMDFREGGEWTLTMHGADGTNYPNRSVFKEIVPLQKIVFEHFNPHFITTILFTTQGDETVILWTMEFDSEEMREIIVKAHKADEGLKQNLERLEKFLTRLNS